MISSILYDFGICFKSVSPDRNKGFWEAIHNIDLDRIIEDIHHLVQSGGETITIKDLDELDFLKEKKFDMSILMKKLRSIFVKKSDAFFRKKRVKKSVTFLSKNEHLFFAQKLAKVIFFHF